MHLDRPFAVHDRRNARISASFPRNFGFDWKTLLLYRHCSGHFNRFRYPSWIYFYPQMLVKDLQFRRTTNPLLFYSLNSNIGKTQNQCQRFANNLPEVCQMFAKSAVSVCQVDDTHICELFIPACQLSECLVPQADQCPFGNTILKVVRHFFPWYFVKVVEADNLFFLQT